VGYPRAPLFDGERVSAPSRERLAPQLLAGGLALALLYAAFASGAIRIPDESKLQLIVAAVALPTLAAVLFGALRAEASGRAWAGIGLLVGFAVWSALSITWSVAPDETWLEVNRTLAYASVAAMGIALGSSLPRAVERVALGYLAIATLVALYALGGKVAPWLEVPGLIDLDHANGISRLRTPIDYWNALGLFCVLAIPIAIRVAADVEHAIRLRAGALVALIILMTTLALTYSRGGLLVLLAALALLVAIGPDRANLAAIAGIGVVCSLPAVAIGVTSNDLTSTKIGGLPLSERTDDGLLLFVALLAGIVLALVLLRRAARSPEGIRLSPGGADTLRRASLVALAVAALLFVGALATSERGFSGSISHAVDSFTEAKADKQNDPARVLQTNSGNRWVWWQEAAGSWWDRPFVGHGAGSFPVVHRVYRENLIDVRQPHSVPLEFLSETGLIGAALGLGGLALLGFAAASSSLSRGPSRERGYAAALLVGCAAWGLHIWVDWDWDIPAVTLPVMVFLGVLAARGPGVPGATNGGRPRQFEPFASLSRGAVLAGGAAVICLFAVSAMLPWLSKNLTSDALAEASSGKPADLREAAKKAEAASRLNPFAVQPLFAAATVAQRSGQPEKAGRLFIEAIERQPDNATTWFRLAGFQVLLSDSPASLKSIAKARSLDPQNALLAFVQLSAVYDERRTATATGTPLPEKVDEFGVPLSAKEPEPKKTKKPDDDADAGSGSAPAPSASAPVPRTPAAPAPAAPAPRAPAPRAPAAPRPPAREAPPGQPFRFEE
jgi:hypothetical protein